MKLCPLCKVEKLFSEFYSTKNRPIAGICKTCFNKICIKRWIERKLQAIDYKGNECEDCKLHIKNSHYSVFEFHHLDPIQKDFSWNKLRLKSLNSIRKELDKCILLCANCHRIRHSKTID